VDGSPQSWGQDVFEELETPMYHEANGSVVWGGRVAIVGHLIISAIEAKTYHDALSLGPARRPSLGSHSDIPIISTFKSDVL
jgi:hypothetical protein